jgi:hypothetical protein
MAIILFRMVNSFARRGAGSQPAHNASQFIARFIVPENRGLIRGISEELLRRQEPFEVEGVSYSGTPPAGKLPPSIRFPPNQPEISMTITAAQLPAIVALIAGILILIMPRLLNYIVAIYLIFVGLVGLGVLKMFRF